jgi:hypothetical protein
MALIAFSIHYESESITDILTVFTLEQLVKHQFAKNLELQKGICSSLSCTNGCSIIPSFRYTHL